MTLLGPPLRLLALGLVLAVAVGCAATPHRDEDTKVLRAQVQSLQALLKGRGIEAGAPARETPELRSQASPAAKASLEQLPHRSGR